MASPTVLILNGILMMPAVMPVPTQLIAADMREMGFRVVQDTHWSHPDEEPVVVIGHSQGGGTALQFAARMKREAKYNPLVITFDAVPVMRCPTKCVNFQTAQYKQFSIPGALNIDVDLPMIPLATHTAMPMSPHLRDQVRRLVAPYAKEMQ